MAQLRQEVTDLNIPSMPTGSGMVQQVKDLPSSFTELLNFPASYQSLTTQGKVMLWASGIMIVVQLCCMLIDYDSPLSMLTTIATTVVLGLIYVAYYTYNINCLVTGGCGVLAYVLAGLMAFNTLIMLVGMMGQSTYVPEPVYRVHAVTSRASPSPTVYRRTSTPVHHRARSLAGKVGRKAGHRRGRKAGRR